tara:strand:+ start:2888 stop:3865 length:978 start_codon:yes stop_codon:yes gene_type:complete
MYNVVVNKLGEIESLNYEKIKKEIVPENFVRIKVSASGINFADLLIIKGKYQERPKRPFSPGLEVSGEIIEVGSKAKTRRKGDKVMSIMKFGGYKQEVIVPEENTYLIPKKMPLNIAGGFPVVYGTAYSALVTKAQIKKNETCLILGATGGVGIAAIEVAKAYGAKVVACGGDDKKLLKCKEVGADFVINYKKNILRTALRKYDINEIDVVIDMIGGQYCLDAVKAIRWEGRIVIVGFASGQIPEVPVNRLLLKNADVKGLYWGEFAYRYPKLIEKDFIRLGKLYDDGLLKPFNFKEFFLKDFKEALNFLKSRKNIGKIVLLSGY